MSHYISPVRAPEVTGGLTYNDVTESVLKPLEAKPNKLWLLAMGISSIALGIGLFCIAYTFFVGIGAWGLNKTIGWAFDITNFVFWIGIGHAGTLISAILLLFRQTWRNSSRWLAQLIR